jgi:hypothetical protein
MDRSSLIADRESRIAAVVSRSVLKSKKRMLLVNTNHQTPTLLPQSDRRQEAYAMEQSTTGQERGQGARTIDEFLRARVRELIEEVLQEEVTATIGTRSARSAARRGYRHGSRPRSLTSLSAFQHSPGHYHPNPESLILDPAPRIPHGIRDRRFLIRDSGRRLLIRDSG